MKKKQEKLYWRRLDNSAKIFPIAAGKNIAQYLDYQFY